MQRAKIYKVVSVIVIFVLSSFISIAQDTTLVKLQNSLDTITTNTQKVDTWVQIAFYVSDNSIEDAKLYLDSAEELATKEDYQLGLAKMNKARGSVFIIEGDYPSALNHLSLARTVFYQLDDSIQLAGTYLLLGNAYSDTNNENESLRYLRSAGYLFEKLNDFSAVAAINNNIGTVFWNQGALDSASVYFNKTLLTYLELNDTEGLATIYTNIGIIYAEDEEHLKAIEYYEKSNLTLVELNRTLGQSINYLNIGDAYLRLGNHKRAFDNVIKSKEIAERDGFRSLLEDQYYTIGEIYEDKGEYENALEWYRKSEVMRDSIFNSATNQALIETQTLQLEEIQESELKKIKQINEGKLETVKLKNTLLLVGSISILILLLVATTYFYKRAKVARKINAQNVQILNQKSKIYQQAKSIAEINETLLEKNSTLEDLNEEKNYIMNVVAHDLKSPLNQIQGLAEVIKMEPDHLSPTQLECLSNIATSSERLSGMINRVLNTRAIESEVSTYVAKEVDLKPLLDQTILNFKPLAERKNIVFKIPNSIDSTSVSGDEHFLQQVLENIISNSIKFSPQNGSVEIALNLSDNKAIMSFKDEGPGLTKEDHKKLFVEYAKLSAQPTGNESSTGLGLSIVKKYVDLMEGDIWCESVHGEGATFFLSFGLA